MKRTELAPITQALVGATVAALVQRAAGSSVQVMAVFAAAVGATLPALSGFVIAQVPFRAWWANLGPPKRIALAAVLSTAAIAAVRLSPASYWLLGSAAAWVVLDIVLAAVGRAWWLRHPLALPVLGGAAVALWKYVGAWWVIWMVLGYGAHLALAAWVGWPGLPWGRRLVGLRANAGGWHVLVRWAVGIAAVMSLAAALTPFPWTLRVPDSQSLRRQGDAFIAFLTGRRAQPSNIDGWAVGLLGLVPQPSAPPRPDPPPGPLATAAAAEAVFIAAGMLAGRRRLPSRLRRAKRMPWPDADLQTAGAGYAPPAHDARAASVAVYIPEDLPPSAEGITLLLPVGLGDASRMVLVSVAPPDRFHRGELCEYTVRLHDVAPMQVRVYGTTSAALRCGVRGAGAAWTARAFPWRIDQVLSRASAIARNSGHVALTEWHVLRAMLDLSPVDLRSPTREVMRRLQSLPTRDAARGATAVFVAPTLVAVLARAADLAAAYPEPQTSWYPLWIALASAPAATAGVLCARGFAPYRLYSEWANWSQQERQRPQSPPPPPPRAAEAPPRQSAPKPDAQAPAQQQHPAETADPLGEFTTDLVAEARAGRLPPIIGAEDTLRQLIETLLKAELSTPVLVGDAGVGKTAAVHKLAHLLAAGSERIPQRLRGARLVELRHGDLVAGTVWRGMFEERLQRLLAALERDPGVILFIDEVHLIMGLGQAEMGAAAGAGQYLKPVLTRGTIRIIGATTDAEYRKFIERDPAMARRMTKIHVGEPTVDEARAILRGVAEFLERKHALRIDPEATALSVDWARRYLPKEKRLPSSAKDLLDAACGAVEARGGGSVSADDLADVIARRTGIPAARVTMAEADKLRALEAALAERVVGQYDAVARAAAAIRRGHMRMADERRPVGVFLFYGPTGVGKTELAKAVAAQLFDTDEAFVRINLAEYRNPSDAARLTGTTAGYAGSEEGGQLTEAVRRRPYSVVLLDEFDKAHADVLHTFLSVFDEGRLVDGLGQVADFTNALIIATSNFGAEAWRGVEPEDPAAVNGAAERALAQLRAVLRPELFNRLTPVAFAPLPYAALLALVRKRVRAVVNRAAARVPGIQVHIEDEVYDALARAGYDPELGARPLERVIEDQLACRIADAMIGAPPGVPLRLRAAVDPAGTVTVETASG